MTKGFLYIIFILGWFSNTLNSQTTDLNQHPSSIKWIKTETPHFNIMAPEELSKQLNETANLMEHVHSPVSSSLIKPRKKLNLFLYNQSTMSNGYVALAPTYSAYYHTPFQDANAVGGSDWFQTLALHEYRHYVQHNKLNDGFSYVAKSIWGDLGQGIFMNLSVPAWFFEGDAICSETALSAGGRGRLPAFTRDIRALELENKRMWYDKAYLGSYKDYVPNHYYLGYILSSGIRKNYGDKAWNEALTRSAKRSFWPWSFSRSLHKKAGGIASTSYKEVLNEYKAIWEEKEKKHLTTNFYSISPQRKVYTNYKYPYKINEESTICLKTGLDSPPALTLISDNSEKELKQINPIDRVHSNGELMTWAVYNSHVRWGQKAFTDIMVYDIQTQELNKIINKQKYFAPAISPSGKKIAVVEYTENMVCSIVIIDAKSGDVIHKFPIENKHFVRMPSWSENEQKLIFTKTFGQNISISILDINNGVQKVILPPSPLNVTSPIFLNEFVIYNSPELGVDAIVAIDTLSKQKYVVASSDYGVYEASLSKNRDFISFQDYSTKGFNIGETKIYPKEWFKIEEFENIHDNYYQYIVDQEAKGNVFENYTADSNIYYEQKRYNSALRSFKIHSWTPYIVNNGLGFMVIANDYLNTTAATAGLEYHPSSMTSRGFFNLKYSKLYPVFDAEISYGRRYESAKDISNNTSSLYGFNEKSYAFGITLPFNLSHRIWQTNLEINSTYNYINQNYSNVKQDNSPTPADQLFSAYGAGVLFSNYTHASRRDINPRFGQLLKINLWASDNENNIGSMFSTVGDLFLPGLIKHHSLQLEAAFESNTDNFQNGIYTQTGNIEFVRGYNKPHPDTVNTYSNLKAIYTLPLLYPDLGIPSIIYFKRIHGSVFYDFGSTYEDSINRTSYFNSVGFDLNIEFNLARFLQFPITTGIRCSYLFEVQDIRYEFLFLGITM